MRSILIYNGLWGYVIGRNAKPTDESQTSQLEASSLMDEKALALIMLGVSKSGVGHIRKAKTSSEAWKELESVFHSKGAVGKTVLCRQLYQMKKDPNKSMSQHVSDFTQMADKLNEAGIKIPSELLSIMLLTSLPDEFENFLVAIGCRDEVPDIAFLKAKLIEEETRQSGKRQEGENGGNNALYAGGRGDMKRPAGRKPAGHNKNKTQNDRGAQSREFKCFRCKQPGHRASECGKRRRTGKAVVQAACEDAMVACTSATKLNQLRDSEWCLDSGATVHINKSDRVERLDNCQDGAVQTAGKTIRTWRQ